MRTPSKRALFILGCHWLALSGLALGAEENEAVEPKIQGAGVVNLLKSGTLDDWKVPPVSHWSLAEGILFGETGPKKLTTPEWIYTQKKFGDFEFTCELRLTGDHRRNTGIYFRVKTFTFAKNKKRKLFEAPSGYEFDAAFHQAKGTNYRGSLGDWYARPSLRIFPDSAIINQIHKEEDWNRMTIRARGKRLEYWLNGIKIMDYVDEDPEGSREGIIGIQIHDGAIMKVECRQIRVLPLK